MAAEIISGELAHQRFLHYNDAAIDQLQQVCRNAPDIKRSKMEEGEEHKYEVRVQSNTTSRPYLGDALRRSAPGDLVHVDLAQIKQLSERGFKWLMVMVDDYNRYVQAYFLKKKSTAPKALMHYCMAIRMPKAVKTDGGPSSSPVRLQQRLTDQLHKFRFNELFNSLPPDGRARARLLSCRGPLSSGWLSGIPSSDHKSLNNFQCLLAIAECLGIALPHATVTQRCICGGEVDKHYFVCHTGRVRITRHNNMRNLSVRILAEADVPSNVEMPLHSLGITPPDDNPTASAWTSMA
ncbi:unnamed protein product [Vitrella brassicaformis CCMP3155]|uniref:Integrase catalytic domain-containing protein n=1 Tax=Vitrella brassicaformis (strain CCMP3155) TaxID=1169540 RepID=A0A0G4H0W8_VITBC|nr:unnamed protein product [Vitrella brassicaformis CCMP3155]|eukprot:CEM36988.1 unnamed protein product [Vitrella brassicaformis CCMP3155]